MRTTHAGAVVFQSKDNHTLFLVVSSSNGRHWVLPKGHIEPKETAQEAALREIREEAGVLGEIITPLAVQCFKKYEEDVSTLYYLVRALKLTEPQENRIVRWEELSTAMELLSFDEACQALSQGAEVLAGQWASG